VAESARALDKHRLHAFLDASRLAHKAIEELVRRGKKAGRMSGREQVEAREESGADDPLACLPLALMLALMSPRLRNSTSSM
jgi:hypothetical protein